MTTLRKTQLTVLAALLCVVFPACKTADEYAQEADDEAYGLIADRRAELFDVEEDFSIDPKADSLRQRILNGENESVRELVLVDCLEIAAENNRNFQTQRESLYRVALALARERFNFGWIPAAGADGLVRGTGGTYVEQSGGVSGALDRVLGTGAVVMTDLGLSLMKLVNTGDGFNAVSDVGVSVTQPLLRGFGKRIVQEPLTQAERNLVYEVRSFERFRRTFAVDVTSRYYRVIQQQNTLENELQNVETLEVLRRRNEALAEAGRLSDIQVDQAKQNELRSRNRLLDAQRRYNQQLDELKLFLGLPIGIELSLSGQTLEQLLENGVEELALGEETVVETALERRLDRLTTLDRVVDADRQVRITADSLRPGLAVSATAGHRSPSGQPASLNADSVTWSLGLGLDLPIGNLPQRNAHRVARIGLQASERRAVEQADEIRVDLRDSMRTVRTRRQTFDISSVSVELAERRVESAQLSLEAGRASTRDLLEAQEDLLAAQNDVTGALIDYALSRLELYRDMEVLVVDEEGVRADQSLILQTETIKT